MEKYVINPCGGIKIEVNRGQTIEIIDFDGGQVVDFFAEVKNRRDEFVSPGVTIDCNESLRLNVGDIIYSNKYTPMFKVLHDDVKEHDYINGALGTSHPIICPIRLQRFGKRLQRGKVYGGRNIRRRINSFGELTCRSRFCKTKSKG